MHVAPTATEVSPLLLVPALLALAVAGCAALGLVEPVRRSTWALATGGAVVLGAVVTLPLYDVPLAAVVGVLVAAAGACFVTAERLRASTADALRTTTLVLMTGAALLALPSDRMVTSTSSPSPVS